MSTRRWILAAVVAAAFGGSYALKRLAPSRAGEGRSESTVPARIVSLAPSTTETLFALGLGDRVVGVTRYCEFPPEARSKPSIGGYYDPNYEALVDARPDLIITLPEHEEVRRELRKLGLRFMTVDHRTVPRILESVEAIGAAGGVPERAAALRAELSARIRKLEARTAGLPRPRVLVSIGRMAGDEAMTRITACGRGGFYDELIGLAGGVNAFEREVSFPAISPEGLLATKPDVVIDLYPDIRKSGLKVETVRAQWKALPGMSARIHVVEESYAVVPGPRVVLLLEEMARAVHPEVFRD